MNETKGEHGKPQPSARMFWFILILPAAVSLLSFLLGRLIDPGIGMFMGMADLLVGLVASVYCGVWLARRFITSHYWRPTLAVLFMFGIGVVNLCIICAGCAASFNETLMSRPH